MKLHFIAIGGAAMHNLAIALYKKDYQVSGSDDEIFEPSKGRLDNYGLLPQEIGWNPDLITKDLDAVILGMHAKEDNPELKKAQSLGLKIYSYPEFLYEQSKDKTRVVIGGSHGKTTITSMVLHVLKHAGIDADFMVGAQLDGFEVMVRLTDAAKIIVLEGDEYLTSPIDRRPKFHLYKPDIALVSGIAWDHVNVFPNFDMYLDQFRIFIDQIGSDGYLAYCSEDNILSNLVAEFKGKLRYKPYALPEFKINDGITYLQYKKEEIPLIIFGKHNLMNLNGARLICKELGVSDSLFYSAIRKFEGASNRLDLVNNDNDTYIFKDFAHSPSKLKATVEAVKEQYPENELIACMELHTFSSLNKGFINEYKSCMDKADRPFVYFNPNTLKHKKLPMITANDIREAFGNSRLKVYTDSELLITYLMSLNWKNKNLLLMSSGNFDGLDISSFSKNILLHK
ncbi:MAG: peptidoglycan synthetase [Bacteroidetes bacterium]|nr:peptidoglycan synthetase [Bacteroidota bacterium]